MSECHSVLGICALTALAFTNSETTGVGKFTRHDLRGTKATSAVVALFLLGAIAQRTDLYPHAISKYTLPVSASENEKANNRRDFCSPHSCSPATKLSSVCDERSA